MATSTTPDLAQAITAAGDELLEELRRLADRGADDVDELLDALGRLSRRIRGKVTRARKRAQPTVEPDTPAKTALPATTSPPQAKPGGPPPPTPPGRRPPATVPASPTTPHRVTMPLTPRPTASLLRSGPVRRARPPLWMHALVILLMVAGVVVAATMTPWGFGGVLLGPVAAWVSRRHRERRRSGGDR